VSGPIGTIAEVEAQPAHDRYAAAKAQREDPFLVMFTLSRVSAFGLANLEVSHELFPSARETSGGQWEQLNRSEGNWCAASEFQRCQSSEVNLLSGQ
jgi:hypothetical protein